MSVERKAAIAAYKKRVAPYGIFAIRCPASGESYVGRAPDLETIRNRIWFSLNVGSSPHRALQAAWSTHGPDSLLFEELERLPEEESAYIRDRQLKEKLAAWAARLGAVVL